jgi:hypothetical protein
MNSEVGPVVVPKGWDYAAASMRKWEREKMEDGKAEKKEGEKVRRLEGGKMRRRNSRNSARPGAN